MRGSSFPMVTCPGLEHLTLIFLYFLRQILTVATFCYLIYFQSLRYGASVNMFYELIIIESRNMPLILQTWSLNTTNN